MAKERFFVRPLRDGKGVDDVGFATKAEAETAAAQMLGQRGAMKVAVTQLVSVVEAAPIVSSVKVAADL